MTTPAEPYQPIDCEVHDVLESVATTRKLARIELRDDAGATQLVEAKVEDIFAREGVEYVALSTGDTVRLDRLVTIDGVRVH